MSLNMVSSSLWVGALALLTVGCTSAPSCCSEPRDMITQVSSYNGLLASLYDGVISYGDLKPYGDFGLGTFDKLDGEMVMIDGILYQVDYDGNVNIMESSTLTPYATLVNFSVDQEIPIPAGLSYDQVGELIESKFKNANLPYAIRIEGKFSAIKCRSIPRQESKPYQSLADVGKVQSVFEKEDVSGTVVGFRYPAYAGAFNVAGFHSHFLNDARDYGGHILTFTTGEGVVAQIDRCSALKVIMPDTEDARAADMNIDRSAAAQNLNRNK